jgi:hypothetical protein
MDKRKAPKPTPSPSDFDEVRVPFDVVMRKLANTTPRRKATAAPIKPASKP